MKTSQFTEIRTDHVDENGVTHLDGFKTEDDNEQGKVLGYFIRGEVYWTDSDYQFDPMVKEVVSELVAESKEGTDPVLEVAGFHIVLMSDSSTMPCIATIKASNEAYFIEKTKEAIESALDVVVNRIAFMVDGGRPDLSSCYHLWQEFEILAYVDNEEGSISITAHPSLLY